MKRKARILLVTGVLTIFWAGVAFFITTRYRASQTRPNSNATELLTQDSSREILAYTPVVPPEMPPDPGPTTDEHPAELPAQPLLINVIGGTEPTDSTPASIFNEPFIRRTRPITINRELIDQGGRLKAGDSLALTFFPDATFTVIVQTASRDQAGNLSISGRLQYREMAGFVLSSAGDVVVAKLSDPSTHQLFTIRCGGPERKHYAVEFDAPAMPPWKDATLAPAQNNLNNGTEGAL